MRERSQITVNALMAVPECSKKAAPYAQLLRSNNPFALQDGEIGTTLPYPDCFN